MSDEKKQIFIDPNMFNPGAYTGGKTNKQRIKPDKQLKIKPSKTVSIKSQRQQFMKKLREKQEQQYISLFSSEKPLPTSFSNKEENEFISDFDKSLEFMNAVSSAPPTTTPTTTPLAHSHTIKNHNSYLNVEPPKYGCLKGGNLPTKRSFTQRLQQPLSQQPLHQPLHQQPLPHQPLPHQPLPQQPLPQQPQLIQVMLNKEQNVPGRLRSPEELQLLRKIHEQKVEAQKPKPKVVQKQIKKIVRRTFQVGKNKHKPVVSVLLPNKTIRNRVSSKSYVIKTAPISDVRKYLIKHGFIKVGSTAPSDVLRKMYESLVLIDGDVKNHNPDNLLFNFFQETKALTKA
jgi:hypothetical protein